MNAAEWTSRINAAIKSLKDSERDLAEAAGILRFAKTMVSNAQEVYDKASCANRKALDENLDLRRGIASDPESSRMIAEVLASAITGFKPASQDTDRSHK